MLVPGDNHKSVPTTDIGNKEYTNKSQCVNDINLCSLITKEESEAVLGLPVTQSSSTKEMCQYIAISDRVIESSWHVSLQIYAGGSAAFETYVEQTEKLLKIKMHQ